MMSRYSKLRKCTCRPVMLFVFQLMLVLTIVGDAKADYDGLHQSTDVPTIAVGESLAINVAVQNTGSSPWLGTSYASWEAKIGYMSWQSESLVYVWAFFDNVAAGETIYETLVIDPENLPTSPGVYRFTIICYRPSQDVGYIEWMDGTPHEVSFTIREKKTDDYPWEIFLPAITSTNSP